MITVLRNAAMATVQMRQELATIKGQNIDITHFEDVLNEFKSGFSRNYEQASKRFQEAIDGIDKTIEYLKKVKEALTKSGNQLRLANNKAEDITIKKLTKDNPTIRGKFIDAGVNIK